MFPTSVMIDLAIVAVVLICVLLGRSRGLFRSLMGLVSVIVALVIAGKAANFGCDLVIDQFLRPAASAAIEQRVDEMMAENITETSPLQEMERVVEAIPNGFIREKAGQMLAELELSTQSMSSYSARETLLKLGHEILNSVLDTAVRSVLHALLYLIVFLLCLLILRLLVSAVDLTLHLPLLRQLNQFGGLLFGAAEGVVLAFLGVFLLCRMSTWVTPEVVEKSLLLKIVVDSLGI